MKKMLFHGGIIGVVSLIIVATLNPWDYDGITGIIGSLLGTGTMFPFILFCAMGLIGIVICSNQAYTEK